MEKEQALRLQKDYLSKISDYIPSDMIDGLWKEWEIYKGTSQGNPVCTCNNKFWASMITELRTRAIETINSQVYVVENDQVLLKEEQSFIEEQIKPKKDALEELQAKAKQRHSKKK